MTTIQQTLIEARKRLLALSSSASLDAQLLLGEVLGVSREYLSAHSEQILSAEERARFEELLSRREKGEPIPYILKRRAFYDRDFVVSPEVLIPRPETELLLEEALRFAAKNPRLSVIDVGTGSGALAVTFAAHVPAAQVYATDISPAALEIARLNAAQAELKLNFLQGNLLQPIIDAGIRADLIMANLPYIASDELLRLEVSRYEPHLALDGGKDGLDLIRRLLNQCPLVCNPGALILLEIGADQGSAVLKIAEAALHPQEAVVIKDYAGLDRIVKVLL